MKEKFFMPDGRIIFIEPKVALAARKQLVVNAEKGRRLSMELRTSRLLPRDSSSFSGRGVNPSYIAPQPEMNSRLVYQAEKKMAIAIRWVDHLAVNGL
jgi:hypothetical protein